MTKRKSVKKQLIFAVITALVCVAMLAGTTFAWFTDTVKSGRNVIKAGNLDVELYYSYDRADWKLVKDSTEIFDDEALWEPGYTEIVYFKVENKGSLALKYKLGVTVFEEILGKNQQGGEFKLSEHLVAGELDLSTVTGEIDREVAVSAAKGNFTDGVESEVVELLKDEKHELAYVISMPTDVGDEANHNGTDIPEIHFGVELYATQLAAEEDAFGPDYDEKAPIAFNASSVDDLADALAEATVNPVEITLDADVTVNSTLDIVGDTIINLNGHSINSNVVSARTFKIAEDGAKLVINATGTVNTIGNYTYGVVEIAAGTENVDVIINGGTFEGVTDCGGFVKIRNNVKANVTLNNVTYKDNCPANDTNTNAYVINTSGVTGSEINLTVNGGSYSAAGGFALSSNVNSAVVSGAEISTQGAAFEISTTQNALIENCDITVAGRTLYGTYAAGVAASFGGKAIVKNCTIDGAPYTAAVYPTGGTVELSGCTVVNSSNYFIDNLYNTASASSITVDGVVVAEKNP